MCIYIYIYICIAVSYYVPNDKIRMYICMHIHTYTCGPYTLCEGDLVLRQGGLTRGSQNALQGIPVFQVLSGICFDREARGGLEHDFEDHRPGEQAQDVARWIRTWALSFAESLN